MIVIPTNTQAELHPIGKNLRVRTAPGQRTATVQLRVDDGLFDTGVGARWIDLPVGAAWEDDDRTGRRYIGVDQLGLETVIGRDAANAALGFGGIAMAKPPPRAVQARGLSLAPATTRSPSTRNCPPNRRATIRSRR